LAATRVLIVMTGGLLALAGTAAEAQLKIDHDVYPDVWNPAIAQQEQEELPPPPPPSFSGDPVVLPAVCEQDVALEGQELEILGAVETSSSAFVFGDYRTKDQTLRSLLLRSEDGGQTWMEAGPVADAATLDSAVFVDEDNGWISGYAEDGPGRFRPFFLNTSDGGTIWRRWDVAPGNEDRFGSIVEFRFDSPKHGYVVIERSAVEGDEFELYETFNAGRSWSIRLLVPERPKIPGGRRILKTSAWNVEFADGAWSAAGPSGLIGRFAVAVGPCPAPQPAPSKPSLQVRP